MKKLFIVAGETSGDAHGANLLSELYKIIPSEELIVKAIGSDHLKNAGAKIFFDSKHLGSTGVTEVISKLNLYLRLEKELLFELQIFNPDVLILVDFPGFNLRLTKKVKKLLPKTKIVYFMPPQAWAWNQGRTKTLSECCDLVLCGLPFEEEFFKSKGVNAHYVGSPVLNNLLQIEKEKARNEIGIKNGNTLIGVFPGSRKSEIHHMLPVLEKAVSLCSHNFPNVKFMLAQAPTVDLKEIKKAQILPPGNNHKLLCASDIVWLTSGTVTLEAALYETPLILGYKGNLINYLIYLVLKRINMIGLPNIIYGEKIVPELIQGNATAENYYKQTKDWINNTSQLSDIKTKLKTVKEKVGNKNACHEAALKIRELIPEYKVFMMK